MPDGRRLADPAVDRRLLAGWLIGTDLAPVAFAAAGSNDPELAELLRAAASGAAAGNLAHFDTLDRIERLFAASSIPVVLLKGAAIAATAYRDPALRPMTDIDLWVRDDDMPHAVAELEGLGFRRDEGLPDRPDELQRTSEGEIGFRHGTREHGRVELHYGAFQGWWARRAASPDGEAVWNRAEPVGPDRHARRLAFEDAVVQTAFHLAVNQLGQAPLRGLMDLAVMARSRAIDWDAVSERAEAWRLATATWLVLRTADRLYRLPGCETALWRLRPSAARRAALTAFVSPRAVLAGRDLRFSVARHAFMLALVDRPRDAARLVGRTLWPESWWMSARYGRPVSRAEHLWSLLRRRAV